MMYLLCKNTRSRTFLTCCQPAPAPPTTPWLTKRTGERTGDRYGSIRPFRACRPHAFKISNTDGRSAGRRTRSARRRDAIVTDAAAGPRPVTRSTPPPAAGPAGQRLAGGAPPTRGPSCHRLRGGWVGCGRWARVGSLKKGGGREHPHSAPSPSFHSTPHSTLSHLALAFLERESPGSSQPSELERETQPSPAGV